jgi:prophage tail gpP-like protein
MLSDKVELRVGGMRIENFERYTVEADMYTADDAFSLDLVNPETPVKPGLLCDLYVNDKPALKGLIDRVFKSYDKAGVKLKVEGRDLCGLLVDSHCEEFITVQGWDIKRLAERLLKKVPFIQRSDIQYQQNVRGSLKKHGGAGKAPASIFSVAMEFKHIEPGQSIFEVLKTFARSRGMIFYALPDGTLVFGKPLDGGDPEYHLICERNGNSTNVLSGSFDENYAKRYSKVTVVGQQQGMDIFGTGGAPQINTKASVTDPEFPFYKPFVATDNNDERSPKLHAQMLIEKMKSDGFKLEYRVPGHSQDDRNWTINKMCQVKDDVLGIDGAYLIYGRTFELSKESGSTTTVKLGLPGMVQ